MHGPWEEVRANAANGCWAPQLHILRVELDIKLTRLGLARLDNEPALLGSARYVNELEGQLGSVR